MIFRRKKRLEENLDSKTLNIGGKEYEIVYAHNGYYVLRDGFDCFLKVGKKLVPLEKMPTIFYLPDGLVAALERHEVENNKVRKSYEIYIAIGNEVRKKEVRTHFDLKDIGTYVKGMLLSLIFTNFDRSDGFEWYYDLAEDKVSISPFLTSPYKNNV